MSIHRQEDGFTLVELMVATSIALLVLGGALGMLGDAVTLNDTASKMSDSNQNLRAGTNMLVRDLMQVGRGIDIGGIPIPSGAGALPISRPSPPGQNYTINNTTATTMPAVITGDGLGPTINGVATDIVTLLAIDPTSYVRFTATSVPRSLPLNLSGTLPTGMTTPVPTLADDGSSLTVGQFTAWLTDPVDGVKPGDVLLFNNANGRAVQTVTSVVNDQVFFAANDVFNFNQRTVLQGSIVQIRGAGTSYPQTDVVRLKFQTYYLDATTTPGAPRLTRRVNHFGPQALAGVVDGLQLSWDLVDGVTNPTDVPDLPATIGGVAYSSNQIRKANVHVMVRSEEKARVDQDYMRQHVSTVVSLRSLAYVDRYE